MSDLVERARAMKVVAGDTQTCVSILVNPDGPALADRIEALESALGRMIDRHGDYINELPGATGVSDLEFAKATLNRSHGADNG